MSQTVNVSNACDDEDVVRRFGVLAERSDGFKQWLLDQLKSYQVHRVLDAACGTGGDSLFLLKNGFQVVSSDSAEAMLRQAKQAKNSRQSQSEAIANWEILNANWLSLKEDLAGYGEFDAVLCIGNSMINLIDSSANLALYRQSFENFKSMLKPGGVLLIDHRNMDTIIDNGVPVNKNVYFKLNTIDKISSEMVQCPGKPDVVNITFDMIVNGSSTDNDKPILNGTSNDSAKKNIEKATVPLQCIRAKDFASLLGEIFGEDCECALYGDFKPAATITDEAYVQHVIRKKSE